MTKEAKILVGVGLLIIVGGWALARFSPKSPVFVAPADAGKLVRDGAYMTGKLGAKVTLIEFGDFQCPACAAAAPVVEKIISEYKDNPNFNFVFRNFPLTEIHNSAEISAEAAEAAHAQGKFWEMYQMLYADQNQWVGPTAQNVLVGYAQKLGLDTAKFEKDLTDHVYTAVVKTDRADGDALGVDSTPTFYLNGEKSSGVPSFDALKAQIDQKLK